MSKQINQTKNPETMINAYNAKLCYLGIPYSAIIAKWWQMYYDGAEPIKSNRDTLTFELALNLRNICGFDRDLLAQIIPNYDGFPEVQKMKCIDSALAEKRTSMPKRLTDLLAELRSEQYGQTTIQAGDNDADESTFTMQDDVLEHDDRVYANHLPPMPMGVKDSIQGAGTQMAMPTIIAICPAIGKLATGVELYVHGKKSNLNLISYIVGDYASNKGSIDPIIDAWMHETKAMDRMYLQQEEEWRAKKRAAKNKKEQPEEPKLPIYCLTLNNTVANLSVRLANTQGKHAFSFTSEADTVSQKWNSTLTDYSIMLRQAYDGSPYEREAHSVDAVNVHIDKLLWNVTMCGTPDALYRVVNNYTDGFQSRISLARTPDNTFVSLEKCNYHLTDLQESHIIQVAHLLPLMVGDVDLPMVEQRGRKWLEKIRISSLMDDDATKARQRFRVCVNAQRETCCLMLCQVCEQLIDKYGLYGAEKRLKQNPMLWKEMLLEVQNSELLDVFDVLADYQLECNLYFFRSRIEDALSNKSYAGGRVSSERRSKRGKNDTIFERLGMQFTYEELYRQCVYYQGEYVSRNKIKMMLKNWKKQGLIVGKPAGRYLKLEAMVI